MKRRPLGVMLAAASALALAVTGCGTTSASKPSAAAAGHKPRILVDYPFTALPIYTLMARSARQIAAKKGVDLEFTNDNMDLQKQVGNLETYLNQGVDAVVSFPMDPASVEGVAQRYIAAGKPWVTYGADMKHQSATIKFSFEKSGEMLAGDAGEWMKQAPNGRRKVLILSDSTTQLGRERTAGMVEGIKKAAPDAVVLKQEAVTPDQGLTATSAVLAKNRDLNVVLGVSGDAAQGAFQALLQAGRAKRDTKTYVGGLDGNLYDLQQMRAGTFMQGLVITPVPVLANAIVGVPLALVRGQSDASVNLPVQLIKPGNPKLGELIKQFGG